jgi:glyoxylase I family protein
VHHLAFHADSREDVDPFHGFLGDVGATILDLSADHACAPSYDAVLSADPDGMLLGLKPELRGRASQ